MHEPSYPFYPSDIALTQATRAQITQLRSRIALHTSAFDFAHDVTPEVQWPSIPIQPDASQQIFARQALGNQIIVDAQLHLTSEQQSGRPLYPYGWMIGRSAIQLTRRTEADTQLASLRYQMYSSGHTDFSAELAHLSDANTWEVVSQTWEKLALGAIDIPQEATVHIVHRQVGPVQVQALGTYIMDLLRSS